jgi:molecular chaperone GrpE
MAESSPGPERPPSESASGPEQGSAASEAVSAPGPASASDAASESLETKVVELEDRHRRALADLENLRKRSVRNIERSRADERAGTAAAWLPVLDNLERALAHADSDPSAVLQGIRAVRDQALQVLAQLGFPRRDDVGAPFDPSRHEAVSVVATDRVPEGTIIEVVRPGYGDDEHQLRPAAVVVAKRAD